MSHATLPHVSPDPDDRSSGWRPRIATGVIVLADGALIDGFGVGATGSAVGEICFNTAMTAAAKAAIASTGATSVKDMGKVVNALKAAHPGEMDFAKASAIVKGLLAG